MYCELKLSNTEKVALVDEEVFNYLMIVNYTWSFQKNGTAVRSSNGTPLHRLIMAYKCGADAIFGKVVDHINNDPLDNRLCNLRACTQGENSRNRKLNKNNKSGFKGVYWMKDRSKWKAHLHEGGYPYYLGLYETAEEAAKAYDAEAKKRWGEYAKLNFPE